MGQSEKNFVIMCVGLGTIAVGIYLLGLTSREELPRAQYSSVYEAIQRETEIAAKFGAPKVDQAVRQSLPVGTAYWTDLARFYLRVGLFSKYRGQDPAIVGKKLSTEFDGERSENPANEWYDELMVLGLDTTTVYVTDPESDVTYGNNVYVGFLNDLSSITSGQFKPHAITEKWGGEEGPVTVSFKLDNRDIELKPDYLDDWIDLGILDQINAQLPFGSSKFYYWADGNWAQIHWLSDEQVEQIAKERGIDFKK